jgi:glycosyltransferase involved in cell wall biosynthesis
MNQSLDIIIPVLNSQEVVLAQIRHLKKFIPSGIKVIMVDDGSTPSLREFLLEKGLSFTKTYWTVRDKQVFNLDRFFIIETKNFIPWTQGIASNIGVESSLSDWVLLTDIDHIITPEILHEAINFTGDCLKFRRKFAILNREGEIEFKPGEVEGHFNSFCMKREIFGLLKGYDETMVWKYLPIDSEFFYRYHELGLKITFSDEYLLVHPDPSGNILKFHNLVR